MLFVLTTTVRCGLDDMSIAVSLPVRNPFGQFHLKETKLKRKQQHWLPIPATIQFKLMTTTWKAINDQAPKYIQQLFTLKTSAQPQHGEL